MATAIKNLGKLIFGGTKSHKTRATSSRVVPRSSCPLDAREVLHIRSRLLARSCKDKKNGSWVRRSCHEDHQHEVVQMKTLFPEEYSVAELIGKGAYGKVYAALEKATGKVVAIKEVEDTMAARQEAEVLGMLQDCPSVVGLKNTISAQHCDASGKGSLYIVMELCQGGDLGTFMEDHGYFSGEQALCVAKEVLEVLKTCQEHRVLHGDVKPCNFAIGSAESRGLLQTNTEELAPGWLKIIDFGTSQEVGLGSITQPQGSPSFWAPEVFRRKYGMAADTWSAGILLFHLQTGCYPFWSTVEMAGFQSSMDLAKAIVSREPDFSLLPPGHHRDLQVDLLLGMLEKTPEKRIKVIDALSHPWIASS